MNTNKFNRMIIDLIEDDIGFTTMRKKSYGYCKIEARGNKCRIQLSVNGLERLSNSTYKANLVNIQKEKYDVVPIDVLELNDNHGAIIKVNTETNNILGSNHSIEDFDLVVIIENNTNEINEIKIPLVGYIHGVKQWKKSRIIDNRSKYLEKEDTITNITPIAKEQKEKQSIINEQKRTIAEEENIDVAKELTENKKEALEKENVSEVSEYKRSKPIEIDDIENQTFEIIKNQFDAEELKDTYKSIFTEYPKMKPFEDNYMKKDWVRIEPSDIIYLPIYSWMLTNNTFILNAYKRYKHLILGRDKSYKEDHYTFTLGVPSIYYPKDKVLAYIYGFKDFVCCSNTKKKPGEYGYWIVEISCRL